MQCTTSFNHTYFSSIASKLAICMGINMNEKNYELSFQIILHGGDAKSKAMEAIQFANQYNFEEANKRVKESQEELKKAHLIQTNLIQEEAQGKGLDMNVLLIHAQDHYTMALVAIENAKQVIIMMERIKNLETQLKGKGGE